MGQRKMPHTQVNRGKRVAIVLRNGQLIEGRFVQRAKNNRWVEVEVQETVVRIAKAEIVSFSPLKGPLDKKRLGVR